MSIKSHFVIFMTSASLWGGCYEAPDLMTAEVSQALPIPMPPTPVNNSNVRVGGRLGTNEIGGLVYSASPPAGVAPSPTGWFVRRVDNDFFAPITSITYNGAAVTELSTTQGWLQVNINGVITKVIGMFVLDFGTGAPVSGTLRLQNAVDAPSGAPTYGQYVATWLATGTGVWNYFCPHVLKNFAGEFYTVNEYMIPVGGAKWTPTGAREEDSNAITLSCTHDSVGGCITWDYTPWGTATAGGRTYSLKNTHQACTRMKRADIVGDGGSSTTPSNGSYLETKIQIWDSFGIHPLELQTTSTMEAFWDTSGAVCFNSQQYRTDLAEYVVLKDQALANASPGISRCPDSRTPPLGWVASARPCLSQSARGECNGN